MNFPTQTFIEFAKQYYVPEYVKTASTKDFEDATDPHSKVGCFFAKFASLAGDSVFSTRELQKRAQIFNIEDDIRRLEADYVEFKEKSTPKTAAPTEKYPIRNKNEFVAAVNYLKKNAYALPLSERRELASKLLEKAAHFGQTTDSEITRQAGYGITDVVTVIHNLHKRADLILASKLNTAERRQKTAEDLNHLAKNLCNIANDAFDAEDLDKIAEALQFLDNEYGLHSHYAGFIDPPDAAVRSGKPKVAETIEKYACEMPGGAVYDIRDFEQLKIADIIDTLGEDFAIEMCDGLDLSSSKIATVLDVMSDLERVLFNDMVKAAGIQARYHKRETVNFKELVSLFN